MLPKPDERLVEEAIARAAERLLAVERLDWAKVDQVLTEELAQLRLLPLEAHHLRVAQKMLQRPSDPKPPPPLPIPEHWIE